jgi:hypothetical protein
MENKTKNGLIVTAIFLVGGYFLYKKLKASSPSNAEIVAELGGTAGVNPTLSEEKLKDLADKIFVAFNGYGTDLNGNNGLINQFSLLRNNDDLMALIAAYGIREVDGGMWNPLPNFKGNLVQTIADELSNSEISQINSTMVKSGISIRFNPDGTLTTL